MPYTVNKILEEIALSSDYDESPTFSELIGLLKVIYYPFTPKMEELAGVLYDHGGSESFGLFMSAFRRILPLLKE